MKGVVIMPDGSWIEIEVVTSSEAVEAVSAMFYDMGASGVAIEDPNDVIESNTRPGDWDYIDEKLLPQNLKDVKVKGYLVKDENINEKIDAIKKAVMKLDDYGIDKGKGDVLTREVKEQDWANAWKQYYKPFKIGKHVVIKPSWEDYIPERDDIVIEIDPGMAFGTGTHETTRMCIELLQEFIEGGPEVFDIGCGSGILSIAASKLGASKVTGIDIDSVAVESARSNVKISGVKNVEILQGNLLDMIHTKADIIVANIIADIIIKLCPEIPGYLNQNGVFISSGIISDRLGDVLKALKDNGFEILKVERQGEWAAVASTMGV